MRIQNAQHAATRILNANAEISTHTRWRCRSCKASFEYSNLAAATPLVNLGKAGPLISAPTAELPSHNTSTPTHSPCKLPTSAPFTELPVQRHLDTSHADLNCRSRHKLQPPAPLRKLLISTPNQSTWKVSS